MPGIGETEIRYGFFLNTNINFLIVAGAFLSIIKGVILLQRSTPRPLMKDCPFFYTPILLLAIRCPACTLELTRAAAVTAIQRICAATQDELATAFQSALAEWVV